MNVIGTIFDSAKRLLPQKLQDSLFAEIDISKSLEASPAGAIFMGVQILEYLGFPRYIDDLLGERHRSFEELRHHYHNKKASDKPLIPSPGIILCILVADMIAHPRTITPAYKFEENAASWCSGPLLGIEPALLNDDRIGRTLSAIGAETQTMEETLFYLIMTAGKKAEIPLNKFMLDTTVLELDGKFKDAEKVVPGRGKNSFAQLLVSLVIASGSRLPVGFGVLAGNTNDAKTLPGIYDTVHRIADEGAVEFLMDRIYPTPSNILFLKEHEDERMVYWVSPLKAGLSNRRVRQEIEQAYNEEQWKKVSYRSAKERKAKIDPPLQAFETTWMLTETIKPDLEPGQKRRPKGSIKTVEMEVRCVFYRHQGQAEKETKKREQDQIQLNEALQDFRSKLNKYKYRELEYCQIKLSELLKFFPSVKEFVQCQLSQTEQGAISLTWSWDQSALDEEAKYDGTFALLTNYSAKQVSANQLVKKYRSRDEIEVDFKQMRGLLDLERVLFQLPERIDCYIFLKVIALFVLAFLRAYAVQEGVKATEKEIQESMGDMFLTETQILPLKMKIYGVARDSELNKLFRNLFSLSEPQTIISGMNEAEKSKTDHYVLKWYETKEKEHQAPY